VCLVCLLHPGTVWWRIYKAENIWYDHRAPEHMAEAIARIEKSLETMVNHPMIPICIDISKAYTVIQTHHSKYSNWYLRTIACAIAIDQ
jgi:hypothetical protein